MRFQILGTIEAHDDRGRIPLGGIKQRATLGYLLLHPNQVVPRSRLTYALWPDSDQPMSARKILHNAIWGLRRTFRTAISAQPASLVSEPSGYLMRVDEDHIDLHRFYRLTEAGRSALATGGLDAAVSNLAEALALWQGPALADLVESGITWPELTALQGLRQDVVEDCMEAELARGNHRHVISTLEVMAESQTLRERSCGQLMRALYRTGRQADALNVYGRWRASLADEFGLDPGRELQQLQQAILTHDTSLTGLSGLTPEAVTVRQPPPAAVREPRAAGETPEATVRLVSVLLVRANHSSVAGGGDQDAADGFQERIIASIGETVRAGGGTVAARIGSTTLALFGAADGNEKAEQAVAVAVGICDRLADWAAAGPHYPPHTVRAAVVTGAMTLPAGYDDSPPSAVSETMVRECESMLPLVPSGEIHVCGVTRATASAGFRFQSIDGTEDRWRVSGPRECLGLREQPDRRPTWELCSLASIFALVRHRRVPHLVTVLGDAGAGKTRLLSTFTQDVSVDCGTVVLHGTALEGDEPLAVYRRMLLTHCGIGPDDSPSVSRAKLTHTVRAVMQPPQAEWVTRGLTPFVDPITAVDPTQALHAFDRLLCETARTCVVVLAVDQLHLADDAVVNFVYDLGTRMSRMPLLVVACARPGLLFRRPGWGAGKRQITTIDLKLLAERAQDAAQLPRRTVHGGDDMHTRGLVLGIRDRVDSLS